MKQYVEICKNEKKYTIDVNSITHYVEEKINKYWLTIYFISGEHLELGTENIKERNEWVKKING